jgi:hypothetical protein
VRVGRNPMASCKVGHSIEDVVAVGSAGSRLARESDDGGVV